ncbi:MAG: alpha/beta hydrolase [Deltaproteobacteria bacterium]|nr:alpha/beta hydrolase [Deltaproteobacteria bacterium]
MPLPEDLLIMSHPEFRIHRSVVRNRLSLAYVREGVGGYPLLLIHGWPETKRIWWRNIEPLAAAGFEVIVPDLCGFGDSDLAPDGHYDLASHARDLHALVHDVLGHQRCAAVAGDLGGAIVPDLALRFPGFVERLCLFNTVTPFLPDDYAAAGIAKGIPRAVRLAADYYIRQSTDADNLAAELDTPARRVRYISEFYGHRFWAAPQTFEAADIAFMSEPFSDAAKFRASIANYEYSTGNRAAPEPPRFFEKVPVPTLILFGPDDHVIPRDFPQRAAVAYPEHVGPFTVAGAGHFLQWEAADVLNQALRYFLADLRKVGS